MREVSFEYDVRCSPEPRVTEPTRFTAGPPVLLDHHGAGRPPFIAVAYVETIERRIETGVSRVQCLFSECLRPQAPGSEVPA